VADTRRNRPRPELAARTAGAGRHSPTAAGAKAPTTFDDLTPPHPDARHRRLAFRRTRRSEERLPAGARAHPTGAGAGRPPVPP
jgi:hypothetical protein